jgi:hypothetical protein
MTDLADAHAQGGLVLDCRVITVYGADFFSLSQERPGFTSLPVAPASLQH